MSSKRLIAAALLSLCSVLSAGVQAATCNVGVYGPSTITLVGTTCTMTGPNITWKYDVVTQATAMALYGAPTIVGDSARFIPSSFRAESLNGQGAVSVAAFFNFDNVFTNSGVGIASITAVDAGDYQITGSGSVSADFYTQMLSNNPSFPLDFDTVTKHFPTSPLIIGAATNWSLTDTVTTAAFAGLANDVAFGIQNNLLATTTLDNTDAWIQKKITLDVTQVVPVPAAAWLLGSGLGLLGLTRRRKTS